MAGAIASQIGYGLIPFIILVYVAKALYDGKNMTKPVIGVCVLAIILMFVFNWVTIAIAAVLALLLFRLLSKNIVKTKQPADK